MRSSSEDTIIVGVGCCFALHCIGLGQHTNTLAIGSIFSNDTLCLRQRGIVGHRKGADDDRRFMFDILDCKFVKHLD